MLGRLVTETERFWEVEFAYNAAGATLDVSSSEELYLHPLFNIRFSSDKNRTGEKLVYPVGSHLERS
jgi:hypothetical protein